MKVNRTIASVLGTAGWCVCFLFFVFHYQFAFNYETEQNNQYYLVLLLPLVSAHLVLSFLDKEVVFTKGVLLWLSAVTLFCSLLLFSNYYSFGNEYFFVLISVFFISGGLYFTKHPVCIDVIIALILSIYVFELYSGVLQWAENRYNSDTALSVKGTLENSGVYACYLVVHLPLLNFARENLIAKISKRYALTVLITFLLLLSISILLIYQTQSRTAYISLFVTITAWMLHKYGQKMWRKVKQLFWIVSISMCLMVLVALSMVLSYLFYMKKMSAMGRLMKTEITLQHIADQFWMGTGIGRFTWYYPQWQAAYFKNASNPPKDYFLSAGESYVIFNEWLQWFKTVGVLGSVATMLLLICFFRAKSAAYGSLFNTLKLTVVAVMACGFTSYPLHVNAFLLLLGFCFAAVSVLSGKKNIPRWQLVASSKLLQASFHRVLLITIVLSVLVFTMVKGFSTYQAARQWQQIRFVSSAYNNKIKQYAELYNNLKTDGKFLTDYGAQLMKDSIQRESAVSILKEGRSYFINRQATELLVEACAETGQNREAIDLQEWLCYYLPNKFSTQRRLLEMYQADNDSSNVKRIAHVILAMPVKIPSLEVDQAKAEAEQALKDQKSSK